MKYPFLTGVATAVGIIFGPVILVAVASLPNRALEAQIESERPAYEQRVAELEAGVYAAEADLTQVVNKSIESGIITAQCRGTLAQSYGLMNALGLVENTVENHTILMDKIKEC